MSNAKLNASIEACEYVRANIDINSIIGVGTGWDSYGDILSSVSDVIETDLTIFPESSSLIDLALESFSKGEISDFELPQPIYLRNNVAQKSLK